MKFKLIYIWYAFPVVLIIVWALVFYLPLSTKTKQKNMELLNVKREYQTADNDMKQMLSIKNMDQNALLSLKETQLQIPAIDEFPDFMREVLRDARTYSVVFSDFSGTFTFLEASQKSILANPVFEIGLKGRFLDIGKFLEALGSRKAFKGIQKAQILHNEKEYPMVDGTFLVEFKAWRQRPDLETK
jgi:Tfp pilus assembly protein PilO